MPDMNEKELVRRIISFLSAKGIECQLNTLSATVNVLLESARNSGKEKAVNEIRDLYKNTIKEIEDFNQEGRFDDIERVSDNILQKKN